MSYRVEIILNLEMRFAGCVIFTGLILYYVDCTWAIFYAIGRDGVLLGGLQEVIFLPRPLPPIPNSNYISGLFLRDSVDQGFFLRGAKKTLFFFI